MPFPKGRKQRKESIEKRRISLIEFYKKNPQSMAGKHYTYKRKSPRIKLISSMKGRKHSEFTRKMMSLVHKNQQPEWLKGLTPWNKGIPHTEDHKMKLKIARRKRVYPRKDSKPERMMQIALSLNGIKFEKHKAIVGQPDIFIEPNICIFIDGDFWHANPAKYHPDQYIAHERFAKDIWANDIKVNNQLSTMGYTIIRLWESDVKNNVQNCAENVINKLKTLSGGVLV